MKQRLRDIAQRERGTDAALKFYFNSVPLRVGVTMAKKKTAKRELIDTGRDKRYMRRDSQGQFKESDDVSRSLSSDRKKSAKRAAKSGHGDKGDRKR
jgi:hypothetical protein